MLGHDTLSKFPLSTLFVFVAGGGGFQAAWAQFSNTMLSILYGD